MTYRYDPFSTLTFTQQQCVMELELNVCKSGFAKVRWTPWVVI
jgi:hypothetical protein